MSGPAIVPASAAKVSRRSAGRRRSPRPSRPIRHRPVRPRAGPGRGRGPRLVPARRRRRRAAGAGQRTVPLRRRRRPGGVPRGRRLGRRRGRDDRRDGHPCRPAASLGAHPPGGRPADRGPGRRGEPRRRVRRRLAERRPEPPPPRALSRGRVGQRRGAGRDPVQGRSRRRRRDRRGPRARRAGRGRDHRARGQRGRRPGRRRGPRSDRAGPDRRRSSARPASASRRCSTGWPASEVAATAARSARTTARPPHDDPSPAPPAARWRPHPRHAGDARALALGRRRARRAAFGDIDELAGELPLRRNCRHDGGEPGCAIRAALADGQLEPDRHRELAEAPARGGPPRATRRRPRPDCGAPALEADRQVRRRRHMDAKYGSEGWR